MKKTFALGIVFLLVLMSFSSISGIQIKNQIIKTSSLGGILYVGGSGPGNYTKIQDAIDNASDGDTVFVYSGTYHIKGSPWYGLVINKSINLMGEDKYKTILEADSKLVVVYLEMMYFVDYVSVNGFTIKNGSTGIYYDTGINNINNPTYLQNHEHYSSAGIYNNILINNNEGIVIGWMSENVYVCNNLITMNKKGIFSYNCFMSNYIYQNTIENNEHGIWVEGGGYDNEISYNIINSNKEHGITLFSAYRGTITRNTIINNSDGIHVLYSSDTNIEYNTLINSDYGIYLSNSEYLHIKGNIITGDTEWSTGILLYDSSNNIIDNSNTISNNQNGIYLQNSSYNKINDNTISNNYDGINLFNSRSNEIISNNINSSKDDGIHLHNTFCNQISNNKFTNNRLNAFFIKEYTILEFIKNYHKEKNIWNENYWNKPRAFPKIIFGILYIIISSENIKFLVMEFDRSPA